MYQPAFFHHGTSAFLWRDVYKRQAKTYVNVIAVKEGNENSDKIKALVDVLKSDEIKDFINEKYDGAVIPVSYTHLDVYKRQL